MVIQKQNSRAYNKKVTPRTLKVGELILQVAWHVQKGLVASKFTPKLEGSYIVHEAYDSGYYLISQLNSKVTYHLLEGSGLNCILLDEIT